MVDSRIDELRRRLERDPGSRLFAQLAEEHRKAGDHAEAIRVARTGLALHPGYASARLTLGRALLESGDGAGARRELEQALREAPDNILASRFLGQALEAVGDLGGALLQYGATLKMAPGDNQLEAQVRSLRAKLTTVVPGRGSDASRPAEAAPRRAAAPPLPAASRGGSGAGGDPVPATIPLQKAPTPVALAAASKVPPLLQPAVLAAPTAAALGPAVAAPSPAGAKPASAARSAVPEVARTLPSVVVAPPEARTAAVSAMPPTDPGIAPRPAARVDGPDFGDTEPARVVPAAIASLPANGSAVAEARPSPAATGAASDAGSGAAPLSSSTLAELYLRQGLQEQAVEVYRQVLSEDPGNTRARARLAEIAGPAATTAPPEAALDPRAARRRSLERTIAGLEALLVALRGR